METVKEEEEGKEEDEPSAKKIKLKN